MAISDPVILPPDVVVVPVESLAEDVRAQLAWQPGDYALTRPRSRTPSSIIDQHTAGLLEQFREPCRIVDAIIRYSDAAALDPHETLERAFPVLQRFLNGGLLMAPDSALAQPIAGTLKRGEVIAGYTVIEAVQIIVDTEVYLVRTLDGAFAALKMARPGAEARVRRLFEAEAETLATLDGRVTPCLIDCGEIDGRPFLAMSWRAGVDGYEASAGARGDSDTGDLLRMAGAIADAYAHLHEQNVLQGDVHPRNVLIDAEFGVTLIDFGMAAPRVAAGGGHRGRRGAVELFADPELAAAQRAGDPLPPVSAEGEQYSVAALLYSLLTGAYTHNFVLEREGMWRQLAEDPPLPFSAHSGPALPAVERTLRRALAKDPSARFESMAAFAGAFRQAAASDASLGSARDAGAFGPREIARMVRDDVLMRLAPAEFVTLPVVEPPTSSVNNGAAGFAYALLRMARQRGDERMLAAADVWITRAVRDVAQAPDAALFNPELDLTSDVIGRSSLSHMPAGVHCVEALVAHARGDERALRLALGAFAVSAGGPRTDVDVAFGRAGLLLGCTLLHEAPGIAALEEGRGIVALGNDLAAELTTILSDEAPGSSPSLSPLGAAHGWAGVLFALLRWHTVTGAALPSALRTRLDELAALATPVGRGVCWPRTTERLPAEDGLRASWCNGSAGFVSLWLQAEQSFGTPRYGALAEAAGWTTFDAPPAGGDLCCGLAGRAYALMGLYRHTGDRRWWSRAAELGERAAGRIRTFSRRADSLYNGEVGVALLAADLAAPDHSGLPLYEAEGWR